MEFSALNWFDAAVITVVLMSSLLAFFRGFLKALVSFIVWVGAVCSAVYISPYAAEYFKDSMENQKILLVSCYVAVFLVSLIIFAIIGARILDLIHSYRKGLVDRSLGLAFGFVRGVLIVCAIFFSIDATSQIIKYGENKERPGPDFFAKAETYNLLNITTKFIMSSLPEDFNEYMVARINKLKDKTMESMGVAESKSSIPRSLNDEEQKLMQQVVSALPEADYNAIKNKYGANAGEFSELDKMAFFRDVLKSYDKSLAEKAIPQGKIVPKDNIIMLDGVLNGTEIKKEESKKGAETGYKDTNIKQLDRLVGSVGEEK